jgi:hypothetical protein
VQHVETKYLKRDCPQIFTKSKLTELTTPDRRVRLLFQVCLPFRRNHGKAMMLVVLRYSFGTV